MVTTVDGIPTGGSTGADTYGRNRYGSYVRRRTKPVNPNSLAQVAVRAAFRSAVNYWFETLTEVQRQAWNDWAAATPWLNRAGQSTRLSGQAAFIRQASFLGADNQGADVSRAVAPPSVPAIGSIEALNVVMRYDISGANWDFLADMLPVSNTWNDATEAGFISVGISLPQTPGRYFKPNRFRFLGLYTGADPAVGPITISIPATSMPISLSITGGQKVWFTIRGWSSATRQLSEQIIVGPVTTTTQA